MKRHLANEFYFHTFVFRNYYFLVGYVCTLIRFIQCYIITLV